MTVLTATLNLFFLNSITDRLSASGTFSYVRKQRTSGIGIPGGNQTSSTAGIGDGIALLRYTLLPQSLWNRYHVAIGGGVKVPLGSTTLNNPNRLRFNADMQPGRCMGWRFLEQCWHASAAVQHHQSFVNKQLSPYRNEFAFC